MHVLYTNGVPDDSTTRFVVIEGKLKNLMTGSSNLQRFLKNSFGSEEMLMLAGGNNSQRLGFKFHPDLIINQISDADSHIQSLERCRNLCAKFDVPTINHPDNILHTRRELLPEKLRGISGLQLPDTVRFRPLCPEDVDAVIGQSNFSYPLIFRTAGSHGGKSTALLQDSESMPEAMHPFALDGRHYYLTQFVDYADADGLFRKSRLVIVGDEIILRHQITSNHWMIHSRSREFMAENPQFQEAEASLLERFEQELTPKIKPAIAEINRRLNLDYYGIDCHIDQNDNILLFELNANMNILLNNASTPNIWEKPIRKIVRQLVALCEKRAGKPAK